MNKVAYPYLPETARISYVPPDDGYMLAAREIAQQKSLDKVMPTGAVVVRDSKIIGRGANGSDYHAENQCERVKRGIPTGQGYELCEGCSPKNHAELRATENAKANGYDPAGADLYLWGHWWCCESCWRAMIAVGIAKVYLMEGSEILFNKEAEGNIVGRQFA
ncbi:MAG TPA: deaminase [Candidatus Paceibacterota bacterium]|nr:deaminase [Candidatus Paceibacterota bacterium]